MHLVNQLWVDRNYASVWSSLLVFHAYVSVSGEVDGSFVLRICCVPRHGWGLVEKVAQRSLTRVRLRRQSLPAIIEVIFKKVNLFLLCLTKIFTMAFHRTKKNQNDLNNFLQSDYPKLSLIFSHWLFFSGQLFFFIFIE